MFIGGVIGALSRAGLSRALPWPGHGWPWATFLVNLTGTLLLGYFVTRLQERLPPSTYRRPLLGTGFCGALTTFSTLQIELIELARHGELAARGRLSLREPRGGPRRYLPGERADTAGAAVSTVALLGGAAVVGGAGALLGSISTRCRAAWPESSRSARWPSTCSAPSASAS